VFYATELSGRYIKHLHRMDREAPYQGQQMSVRNRRQDVEILGTKIGFARANSVRPCEISLDSPIKEGQLRA
jgi:hypothetical protein